MNRLKTSFIFLLMVSFAFSLTWETKYNILFSARQADLNAYYMYSGVVLEDTPKMNPYFTCLRVAKCRLRIWYYESTAVVLPCFATQADYVSCAPVSHMMLAMKGIEEYENGNVADGVHIMRSHMSYDVPLE